jgi:hypothetical protein
VANICGIISLRVSKLSDVFYWYIKGLHKLNKALYKLNKTLPALLVVLQCSHTNKQKATQMQTELIIKKTDGSAVKITTNITVDHGGIKIRQSVTTKAVTKRKFVIPFSTNGSFREGNLQGRTDKAMEHYLTIVSKAELQQAKLEAIKWLSTSLKNTDATATF